MEQRRRLRVTLELAPLGALDIGVEDETARVRALAQNHPRVGQPIGVDGGERHRLRIVDLRGCRFREPKLKQRERVRGLGKVEQTQFVQGDAAPRKGRAQSYPGQRPVTNERLALACRRTKGQMCQRDMGSRAYVRRGREMGS